MQLSVFLLVALQAGCGGPHPVEAPSVRVGAALPASPMPPDPNARSEAPMAASHAQAGRTQGVSPHAEPIDHAARTRTGLYLHRDEADQISRERRGQVIWVDASCCVDEELELIAMLAYGEQATRKLGADTPVFVTGADQRLAARLVDRLGDAGIPTAHLVTR